MGKQYIVYINRNFEINEKLKNKIKDFIKIKEFEIEKNINSVKLRGLEFKLNECPILLVGKNYDHGFAYDIFKEYFKQRKPKRVIIDLRDYHSDSFDEKLGKSWSWVLKLLKEYSKIEVRVYNCKESYAINNEYFNRIFISPELPKKEEIKNFQNTKQKIITSLDMDFLYLNNFNKRDFGKIIKSLDYPRDYIDVYFFNFDDCLQVDFLLSFLKYLSKYV